MKDTRLQERPEGRKPVVLVCPLNWGLGHAARCIPLVRVFMDAGCQVVVAAEGGPLAMMQQEFNQGVRFYHFPGMNVRYPSGKNMVLNMTRQLPGLLYAIWTEHRLLKHIVQETNADVVVSDNRYGLWHKGVSTVFLTHQVFIQVPPALNFMESALHALNHYFIKKFDQCWVPDFPGKDNLSGLLSHKKPLKGLRFVGPLSRFAGKAPQAGEEELPSDFPSRYYLVILSGPEPQRSLLEKELIRQFDAEARAVVFVRGRIKDNPLPGTSFRTMLNHASTPLLKQLIERAQLVICRPGYSTLMDLSVFGKKALVIPTPGQTEQEYLGWMLQKQNSARCVTQDQINLSYDLAQAEKMKGIREVNYEQNLPAEAVKDLLRKAQ